MKENPGPKASRILCRLCPNIRGLYRNLSDFLLLSEVEMWFFVSRLLSSPGATFPSVWFQVFVDRCSCSGVRLIGCKGWLHTCVVSFQHTDSAVMSVDVVKS